MIIGVPIAVGMVALARPIIGFLFGLREFEQSIILLQILSASLLLIYVDFVLNTVLISNDRQKRIVIVSLVATVINVTVNYYAIAYFQRTIGNGAIGAAITTAITELCVMSMSIDASACAMCFLRERHLSQELSCGESSGGWITRASGGFLPEQPE
jgi:O-antigen/teichoic acid export membrane protein